MKNTEERVDLHTVEVRIDQGSKWPMEKYELTKVEMTKDRADHKPTVFVSDVSITYLNII